MSESIQSINMSTARMASMVPLGHVHRLPLARDVDRVLQRVQCPMSHTAPTGDDTIWFDIAEGVFKVLLNGEWQQAESMDQLFPAVPKPGTGTGDGVPKVGETYVLDGAAGIVLPGGEDAQRSDQTRALRYSVEKDSLEFLSARGWISFQEANYEYEQFNLRVSDFLAIGVAGATAFAINADPAEPQLTVAVLDGLRSLAWSKNIAGSTHIYVAPLYSGGPSNMKLMAKAYGETDWVELSTTMVPESEQYTSFVLDADISTLSGLCLFALVSDAPTLRISELVVNLQ